MSRWTLTKGAQEFGIEPKTLRAKLEKVGIVVEKGARYSTLKICGALYGDKEKEQTRLLREQADGVARQNAEKAKDLIPKTEALRIITEHHEALARMVRELPNLCQRCNPENPKLAEAALQEHAAAILAFMSKA